MPLGVVQELTRILSAMQEQGVKCVWLSEENQQAIERACQPGPPQLPGQPAATAPTQAHQQTVGAPVPQVQTNQPAWRNNTTPPPSPVRQQTVSAAPPSSPAPPPAVPSINTGELAELASLKDLLSHCQTLLPAGARLVTPQGQPQARLIFVGDYPNADEAVAGQLLVGKAGTMLRKMGEAMGLHWQDGTPDTAAYATTILKYRPSSMPSEAELNGWLPVLQRELELVKPQAIVLLGGMAAGLMLGHPVFSAICGTVQKYRDWPTLVIQNPAQIIRFESLPEQFNAERKRAWLALQQMMSLLGLSRPK